MSRSALILSVLCICLAGAGAQSRNGADIDTSKAVPLDQAGKLPNTEQQYRSLQNQIERERPGVRTAKQQSEALNAQATALRRQLVATAARVQFLEREQQQIDSEVLRLRGEEKVVSADFVQGRVRASRLLAVVERLQTDLPPAMALQPADALASARSTMVLGAALPKVYGAAADLSRRLRDLKHLRATLLRRRVDAARNAAKLSTAQRQLDALILEKEREAGGATARYAALEGKLTQIAAEAYNLKNLLDRVAALRHTAPEQDAALRSSPREGPLRPGELARPVVGSILPNPSTQRWPGLNFLTSPDAAVVAPADSHVLFAGPYHTSGQILILETTGGYDLVLAGLARLEVRPGDELLAGEPVGRMPHAKNAATLYFELRKAGKSMSPAPWLAVSLRKATKS